MLQICNQDALVQFVFCTVCTDATGPSQQINKFTGGDLGLCFTCCMVYDTVTVGRVYRELQLEVLHLGKSA